MKLKTALSMVLLALASAFGFPARREEICNEASTVGIHTTGVVPLAAEETITTRYLLVKKGTAANGFVTGTASVMPWGICQDEPTSGNKAAIAMLGAITGTTRMRANGVIAAGAEVYTAAGGKVSTLSATAATYYKVGRAVTAAAADGDLIEVVPCYPVAVVVS